MSRNVRSAGQFFHSEFECCPDNFVPEAMIAGLANLADLTRKPNQSSEHEPLFGGNFCLPESKLNEKRGG